MTERAAGDGHCLHPTWVSRPVIDPTLLAESWCADCGLVIDFTRTKEATDG